MRVHPENLERQKLPRGREAGRRLEAALPRDQRLGALPRRQRLPDREALPQPLEGGAARRLLRRIDLPDHNWKFSEADVAERELLGRLPARVLRDRCRTRAREWAPWHVIPADRKWFARLGAAAVIVARADGDRPALSDGQRGSSASNCCGSGRSSKSRRRRALRPTRSPTAAAPAELPGAGVPVFNALSFIPKAVLHVALMSWRSWPSADAAPRGSSLFSTEENADAYAPAHSRTTAVRESAAFTSAWACSASGPGPCPRRRRPARPPSRPRPRPQRPARPPARPGRDPASWPRDPRRRPEVLLEILVGGLVGRSGGAAGLLALVDLRLQVLDLAVRRVEIGPGHDPHTRSPTAIAARPTLTHSQGLCPLRRAPSSGDTSRSDVSVPDMWVPSRVKRSWRPAPAPPDPRAPGRRRSAWRRGERARRGSARPRRTARRRRS